MKQILLIIIVLTFLSCKNKLHEEKLVSNDSLANKEIRTTGSAEQSFQYTLAQKLNFLDSINSLKLQSLKDSIIFYEDSIFNSRSSLNHRLSETDFFNLKNACRNGIIDLKSIKRMFPGFNDTTFLVGTKNDSVLIELISFDKEKNGFDEYAVSIGLINGVSWSNTLYFFKKNILISRHDISHRYGLEINHFWDQDGNTVIYYKENFGSGSGIWQFNYYFYKYSQNKLIPVLNILQNGNYNWPGPRGYWLEASVITENPLKIKFEYNFYFRDSLITNVMNDSSIVNFSYNNAKKKYLANFRNTKISQDKILAYYLGDNELIFINSYYKEIKNWIEGNDKIKRKITLDYLNEVMNYEQNNY